MINRRRHIKYIATFEERLAQEALELKQAPTSNRMAAEPESVS